jgi:hypothetical protein
MNYTTTTSIKHNMYKNKMNRSAEFERNHIVNVDDYLRSHDIDYTDFDSIDLAAKSILSEILKLDFTDDSLHVRYSGNTLILFNYPYYRKYDDFPDERINIIDQLNGNDISRLVIFILTYYEDLFINWIYDMLTNTRFITNTLNEPLNKLVPLNLLEHGLYVMGLLISDSNGILEDEVLITHIMCSTRKICPQIMRHVKHYYR